LLDFSFFIIYIEAYKSGPKSPLFCCIEVKMQNMDELKQTVLSVLESMGVELVELQFNRGKRSSLRVFVWEEGGISLERCTEISRQLSDILDRKDAINHHYFLEVSSPGVDRPLKTRRDFERQAGRQIRATIRIAEDKELRLIGRLSQVDEKGIHLEMEGHSECFPFEQIVIAKVMVEI